MGAMIWRGKTVRKSWSWKRNLEKKEEKRQKILYFIFDSILNILNHFFLSSFFFFEFFSAEFVRYPSFWTRSFLPSYNTQWRVILALSPRIWGLLDVFLFVVFSTTFSNVIFMFLLPWPVVSWYSSPQNRNSTNIRLIILLFHLF